MRHKFILIGVFIGMVSVQQAMARSPERIAVRVQCVAETLSERDRQALCRHLVQSLARVMPRAAPRQVPASLWRPHGAGDVSVRLELSAMRARLIWQIGPDGARHSGPDITLPAPARADGFGALTDHLVTSTYPELAATRAAASQ